MAISLDKQRQLIEVLEVIQNLPDKTKDEGSEISIAAARRAKVAFRSFMNLLGIDSPLKGLSLSVSFGGVDFITWLGNLQKYMKPSPTSPPNPQLVDELRIVFARYTDDFLDIGKFNDENIGRLTVLLWPFKDKNPAKDEHGNLIKPFDLGGLYP